MDLYKSIKLSEYTGIITCFLNTYIYIGVIY